MYPWLVLLHVLGVFGFLMAHGISSGVALELRREREPGAHSGAVETFGQHAGPPARLDWYSLSGRADRRVYGEMVGARLDLGFAGAVLSHVHFHERGGIPILQPGAQGRRPGVQGWDEGARARRPGQPGGYRRAADQFDAGSPGRDRIWQHRGHHLVDDFQTVLNEELPRETVEMPN